MMNVLSNLAHSDNFGLMFHDRSELIEVIKIGCVQYGRILLSVFMLLIFKPNLDIALSGRSLKKLKY